MKELRVIECGGFKWFVDGRLGEIRRTDLKQIIKFDDLEDDFNFDLIENELFEYYNK